MMNNDIFTATYSPGSDPLIPVNISQFTSGELDV